MAVVPKLTLVTGIAIAGLGLVGAGAGATFTAQVAADTTITSGGVGLSLNGKTGSEVHLDVDGQKISSHFTPISKDLVLKNTGTLDMPSTFLGVTATGCDGSKGSDLAKALQVKLTDETNNKDIYDGTLCALVSSVSTDSASSKGDQGFTNPRAHTGVGGQLPLPLNAGKSITYRIVIQPKDAQQGLPPEAQNTSTSVKLLFNGFDY